MSFARQLVIGVATLVLITVITGAVAIVALRDTTHVQEAVARDFATDLMAVERLRFEAEHLVASTRGYLIRRDHAGGTKFTDQSRELERLLDDLHARGLDEASQSFLHRIDAAAADYIATTKQVPAHDSDALGFYEEALQPKRELLQRYLTEFVEHQQNIFEEELRSARSAASSAQVTVVVTTGLALLLSTGLALVVMRKLGRLYTQERAAARLAQREATARQEVLAVVSHDLRNPLNTIVLASSLLDSAIDAQHPLRRHATAIANAAERMTHMIGEILDETRIEAGTIKLHRSAVDVGGLLATTQQLFQSRAEARSIRLEIAPPQEPVAAWADPERVVQVLSNLVSNALRFTPERGAIVATASQRASEVEIAVSDTGPGLPAAYRAHVFERHWQAPGSGPSGGLGLGLYICKNLVEAHGGQILVEDAPGGGARFRFTLPVA